MTSHVRRPGAVFLLGLLAVGLAALAAAQTDTGVAASASGGDKTPTDVIIEVGTGTRLTRVEIEAIVGELPDKVRQQMTQPQGREQLLREIADIEVLKAEADRRGVTTASGTVEKAQRLTLMALAQKFIQSRIDAGPPNEAAIKAYYDQHRDDFRGEERLHLYQLTVADRATAEAAKAEISKGTSFAEVARTRSLDSFKSSGGDRGFMTAAEIPEPLQMAVASLKDGEVSEPVEVGSQTLLASIKEREPGRTQSLDEVRTVIGRQLQRDSQTQSLDAILAELGPRYGLASYPERFKVLAKEEYSDTDKTTVLFSLGTTTFDVSRMARDLEQIPAFIRPQMLEGEGLTRFVQQFILRQLVERHVEQNLGAMVASFPMVARMTANQAAVMALLEQEVADRVKLDDDALRAFYLNNRQRFNEPEKYRASHILVPDEDAALKLRKEIEGGASFPVVAAANSTCPSKAQGGDLGWFESGRMVPEFEKAVASGEVGKLVGPVKTQFGFHLILPTGKQEATVKPFEEVREQLAGELKREKQREVLEHFMGELRKATRVVVHPEKL